MARNEIHVTLTDQATIEFVRAKVRSGEYISEEEVVKQMLLSWQENEAEFDRWLKEDIVKRCAELDADPSTGIPVKDVEARLAERRKRRTALAS